MAHLAIQRRLQLLEQTLSELKTVNEADLTRLHETARDDLAVAEADIEELELAAEDCVLESERLSALDVVRASKDAVEQARAKLRQATLDAKRRFGSTRLTSQRQRLLGDPSAQRSNAPKGSGEDELMNATSDVTASLRRTMQLMQQELDRSLLSNQLLEQSTGTMNLATEQHVNFTTLLSASKSLITSMERADVIDRLLIFGALLLFALVCLYIFHRRIIKKGLRAAAVVGSILPRAATKSATPELAYSPSTVIETLVATATALIETVVEPVIETVRTLHQADEL